MQFEVNIPTYKRVDNRKKKKGLSMQLTPIKAISILLIGFMFSRVNLNFVEGISLAPFGIAYLVTVFMSENKAEHMLASLAVIMGYLTIYRTNSDVAIYVSTTVLILLYRYTIMKFNRDINKVMLFIGITVLFCVSGIFFGDVSSIADVGLSLIKAIAIIPMFVITKYGVNCLSELNTNYFYSTEELISMAIVLCLIIAGIGNINILGVEITSLIALSTVVIIAYAGGSSAGAIIGITMGIIVGVANGDLVLATTLYGTCGLIVGVFRETGRVFSTLAFVVMYSIVMANYNYFNYAIIIESLIVAMILMTFPDKFLKRILVEINNEEKMKVVNNVQIQGIKSEFVDRLDSLKNVLYTMSTSLNNLSENDKLLLKNKGVALVENLADRVCYNCELNRKCWDRELHSTFSAFGELIKSCEDKRPFFPQELNLKCVKRSTLLKNAEDLLNTHTINETLKSRLVEGRKIIANQIKNMSFSINDIINDFEKDVSACGEVDKLLRKTLNKNKIKYKDIYTYTDRNGRLKIKMKLTECDGCTYCTKNILPIISESVRVPLSISDEGCRIDPKSNNCSMVIEETPKYHISSYAAFTPKDGEKYSGDSFSFSKNAAGAYITAISDGMGSGPEAGLESSVAIELIEKFLEAGFSEKTTLNTVNSIMSMKFNEDEKFTTLDMNVVDLYTGDVVFLKVGGVSSFIKSGENVEVIDSSNLPFGILDNIEIEGVKKKVKHGDIIVTISDGVLDIDKANVGDYNWVRDYLKNSTNNPELLSRDILEKAKKLSNEKIFDDMTVVVSKVYSVC